MIYPWWVLAITWIVIGLVIYGVYEFKQWLILRKKQITYPDDDLIKDWQMLIIAGVFGPLILFLTVGAWYDFKEQFKQESHD